MNTIKNLKRLRIIIYFLFLISTISLYSLAQPKTIFAGGTCSSVGQCINGKLCTTEGAPPSDTDCGGSAIIGGVAPPEALSGLVSKGAVGSNAIVFFISRIINFGTIIAGIITVGNFIAAGVMYISAGSTGDTGIHAKVKDKLTYGIIGLVIIVASYTMIGLVGLIFFGNPLFTLNPSLRGL